MVHHLHVNGNWRLSGRRLAAVGPANTLPMDEVGRQPCWKCEGTGIKYHRKQKQNPAKYAKSHPDGPPQCTVCAGAKRLNASGRGGGSGGGSGSGSGGGSGGSDATDVLAMARDGELGKLQLLGRDAVARAADRHSSTAMHWAAGGGHLELCRWLVREAAADTAQTNRTGRTPLHMAARNGRLEVCRWLVGECGVPASVAASHGVTPLQLATWQNHLHVCEWLADSCSGVDIQEINGFGCTVVHWLAMSPGVDADADHALAHWYLARGLDFRRRNTQGHTPLHKAAFSGHASFCRWLTTTVGLLDSQPDESANYAADMAEMGGHPALAAWLRREASAERQQAFAVLGLALDAGEEQMRTAYRSLARSCHPDKQTQRSASEPVPEGAAEADQISWHQLQQAYEILAQPPVADQVEARSAGTQRNAAHDLRLMLRMVADGDEGDSGGAVENSAPVKRPRSPSSDAYVNVPAAGEDEDDEGWSEESVFKARLAAVLLEYEAAGIPLANLPKKYRQVWGVNLPTARALGKRKMVQVLRSMPDVVTVEQSGVNHVILHAVKTRDDLKMLLEDGTAE